MCQSIAVGKVFVHSYDSFESQSGLNFSLIIPDMIFSSFKYLLPFYLIQNMMRKTQQFLLISVFHLKEEAKLYSLGFITAQKVLCFPLDGKEFGDYIDGL